MNLVNEKKEAETKTEVFQIIVFKQGEEEYALHIDQIKEVVITPVITRMPQTPDFIKGVANVRGNIIAIIDLEEKFNLKRREEVIAGGSNYTLVIESDDLKMGVLVREVPNTLTVKKADLDDTVHIIGDASGDTNYITGIIKANERLIILIDIFKAVDQDALGSLNKSQVA